MSKLVRDLNRIEEALDQNKKFLNLKVKLFINYLRASIHQEN